MFRLQLTYPTGVEETLTFASPFLRGLHMIALSPQPVTQRIVPPVSEVERTIENAQRAQ
jgi:hypothetical protein